MSMPLPLAGVLLVTSALLSPAQARAQSTDGGAAPAQAPTTGPATGEAVPDQQAEEAVDVSVPGGEEIVVTGRRDRDVVKTSAQVVSVLGAADIARTGEGNIAGALGRVTGLSVVGNGFVYVRGLGDRYSLALLNGSPLPSPEPLRRTVPLDIFPTGVIASSLVQKSYSVNFPGEFGGGVINLTTQAVPKEPFLSLGLGASGDSETTGQVGYTYYGSKSDDTGFDNGERDTPPALAAFLKGGQQLNALTPIERQAIGSQLITGRNAVVQRGQQPANVSANLTGGVTYPVGDGDLGIVAALGFSNRYTTRNTVQQTSFAADLSALATDFRQVNTDQRIVVNGLVGVGYEFGDNKIRWTNLFVRDTIKQARLSLGNRDQTTADFLQQRTAWFERQLFNSQLVSEITLADGLKLDLRSSYANSQREAPNELFLEYVRSNTSTTIDPVGNLFVNRVRGGNLGDAQIVFSDLNENLYSASGDLTYRLSDRLSATAGGAWSYTRRTTSRRLFQFNAPSNFPDGVGALRPDLLLRPAVISFFNIDLLEPDTATSAFDARLRNYASYAKINASITETISLDAGVRYERAKQTVSPIEVFAIPTAAPAGTNLERDYWLPAATLTWQVRPDVQVRLNASKTIARPQFRELVNQPFFDPESNRVFRGNPQLVDSQLYNAEARIEYYFARDQRVSLSAFFKRLDKPIETFLASDFTTSFANAPKANLYGAEIEAIKYFDLAGFSDSDFFAARRLVVIGNYTFTKSKLKVAAGDNVSIPGVTNAVASEYFRDGSPLTGQSDHIGNFQLGLEDQDKLSQQTILVSYASDRVVSRGLNGTPPQPDVIERPGLRIDFVAREGIEVRGKVVELKFEARNITGRRHEEFQQAGATRIDFNTYDVGTTLAISASLKL